MDRAETKPTLNREEAKDLVREVLRGVDGDPRFILGTIGLAPLPWVKEVKDPRKYRKDLINVEGRVIKDGMRLADLEKAHALAGRIHLTWKELSQPEGRPVQAVEIRRRLIEEGVIKEWALPDSKEALASEPRTNSFHLLAGSRPYKDR